MIKDRLVTELPRERLMRTSATTLSLREVLALILGSGPKGRGCLGLAEDILRSLGHDPDSPEAERALLLRLASGTVPEFPGVRGLGPAGGCRLAAGFELGRRYALMRQVSVDSANHSGNGSLKAKALSRIAAELRAQSSEWFGFIPVYRGDRLGSFCLTAAGSMNRVTVDLQALFSQILNLRPDAIFLAHNHPSGDTTPSDEDRSLTKAVNSLASAFGIILLGHAVVTGSRTIWM